MFDRDDGLSVEGRNYTGRRRTPQERPRVIDQNEAQGLPVSLTTAKLGCNCGACVEGTIYHDCELCQCIVKKRYIFLPEFLYDRRNELGNMVYNIRWDEGTAAREILYVGGCRWETEWFDGPLCIIGEGEETEVVTDQYRWWVDITPDENGLIQGGLERKDDTDTCVLVEIPFCAKGQCGGPQCLCAWQFEAGPFNNVHPPTSCTICISPETPFKPNVEIAACSFTGAAGATVEFPGAFPGVMGDWYMSNPADTPKKFTFATIPGEGMETYNNRPLSDFAGQTLFVPDATPPATTTDWYYEQFTSCDIAPLGIGDPESALSPVIVEARCSPEGEFGILKIGVQLNCNQVYGEGGEYVPALGVPHQESVGPRWYGEVSLETFTIDQFVDLYLVTDEFGDPVDPPDETCVMRVKLSGRPKPNRPMSSGQVGSSCGEADVEPTSCHWIAAEVGGSVLWTVDTEEENCVNCYVPCASTYVDGECGNAATLGAGTKCERACLEPYETDFVEFSLEGGMGCEGGCLPASVRLCTVDSTSFEGPIVICGSTRTITLEDNGTDWTMTISGGGPITGEFEGPWTLFTDVPGCGTITLYLVV